MSNSGNSLRDPDTAVLIVEDNAQYAHILRAMLSGRFGYSNITHCSSTSEAYKAISQDPQRYRLLFVDYHFPGEETGGSLLSRLREEALLKGKVAFLITSEPTMDNLKEALAAGARGVVAKPFDSKELQRQILKAERALETDAGEGF